jgi:hypothetical protein
MRETDGKEFVVSTAFQALRFGCHHYPRALPWAIIVQRFRLKKMKALIPHPSSLIPHHSSLITFSP